MPPIGVDEWADQVEGRADRYTGFSGRARKGWDRVPNGPRFGAFLVIAAVFPFLTSSDYLIRVGLNVLLFALLALGLNVVVGWGGLLDLGYAAFYGFGAYGYALVSSSQFGLHWPTIPTIIAVVVATALLGLLLGLPSRRLSGDYLAIVTLFFAQIFVELTITLDRINLPFSDRTLNLTGGPNGIPGVDGWSIFGLDLKGFRDYYYLLLVVIMLAVVGLHHLNQSRTGRAWRAMREDQLAAELMTSPVNRLKLMAFMFGAGIAGLSGSIFAAVQVGVFPQNFEVTLLIMIYAALILGGVGLIPGAILGAIIVASVPEILRTPSGGRWLFYGGVALGLILVLRPWIRLVVTVVGTIALGFVVHAIVAAGWPGATDAPAKGGAIGDGIGSWMVILPSEDRRTATSIAFVLLIAAVLALTLLRGWRQVALLIPTLYLAGFVWENLLVFQPSVTRQLLFGAILIVMMAARPQGLVGRPSVEIV